MSMVPISQQQILSGLMAHDSNAQRALLSAYLVPLQAVCTNRFGLVREDAEEVVLDVLLTLMLDPSRFDESRGVPLLAWLKRVTANRAIDRIRQFRRMPAHFALKDSIAADDEVEDTAPLTALSAAVASVVVELPVPDRQVLMWHVNAIPYSQLASWTGRSEVSLRQSVRRSKRRIRERVEKHFRDTRHDNSYQV